MHHVSLGIREAERIQIGISELQFQSNQSTAQQAEIRFSVPSHNFRNVISHDRIALLDVKSIERFAMFVQYRRPYHAVGLDVRVQYEL